MTGCYFQQAIVTLNVSLRTLVENLVGVFPGDFLGFVVAVIVDDDNLEAVGWVVLGGNRSQAVADMLLLILGRDDNRNCLLYTSPSPRDQRGSRMPSSA